MTVGWWAVWCVRVGGVCVEGGGPSGLIGISLKKENNHETERNYFVP